MEKICLKMVEDGLMSKVIVPSLERNGLQAQIGDLWFYFGGSEFEYTPPDLIPFGVLAREIKEVLDDFYEKKSCEEEYRYYYRYLCEHI